MPSPQQVAEEAQQMAEEVAHHAHHFASHLASEQVANVMRGIWTAWTGQQGQGQGIGTATFSTSSSSSSSSSSSRDNQQQEQSQSGCKSPQQNDSNQSSPRTAGEEYLNVGEGVASMLDPLGIDVEVSVEQNGIRQRCSLGENSMPGVQIPVVTLPPSPPPETSKQPSTSGTNVNMEVQTGEPSRLQTTPTTSEDMDVGSPAPAASHVSVSGDNMEAEHTTSPEPEDWTLVSQEPPQEQSQAAAKPKTPPPQKVEYPSLTEFQPHPNPVIQRALEQMQAMGYNNEGGWLSNLLEMKQGDINQVLDLLQPVSK